MHLKTPAGYSSDDFLTGSRAALFGGTTTLLDFVTSQKGQSLVGALEKRKEEAMNSMADYSFHVSPVEWRDSTEMEINKCISEGVSSFKLYMAYKGTIGLDDNDILKVMKVVGRAGKTVTIHCESGDKIEELRNKLFAGHDTGPRYHALSRPSRLEAGAVKKAVELAYQAGCQLYIVHVSAKESLKHIEKAQSGGQMVFAETCPQYLLLDDSRYNEEFRMAAPYIISPPLRGKADNDALWDAISKGTITSIGSDHCPFNQSQKEPGLNDFRKIPNGAGGVEHRLALLYTFGVLKNLITMNQLVDLFSTQPAKIFGLYPHKGDIIPEADADLVIWNPESENTISFKTHHQRCDNNIYEGIKIRGNALYVIAGGKIVIEDNKLSDPEIRGRFLKR
jgi:dihydropyrimidinase